jgi:hypothetical protein
MECNGPGLKQAGKKAVHQAEAIEHRRGIRRELDSRSRIFDPVVALKKRDRPAALRQGNRRSEAGDPGAGDRGPGHGDHTTGTYRHPGGAESVASRDGSNR